jgi:hypothetical protein
MGKEGSQTLCSLTGTAAHVDNETKPAGRGNMVIDDGLKELWGVAWASCRVGLALFLRVRPESLFSHLRCSREFATGLNQPIRQDSKASEASLCQSNVGSWKGVLHLRYSVPIFKISL